MTDKNKKKGLTNRLNNLKYEIWQRFLNRKKKRNDSFD
jgi:hypothetical protein